MDLHGTNFFYSVLNSGSWIACCDSVDPGEHLKSDVAPCCKLSCRQLSSRTGARNQAVPLLRASMLRWAWQVQDCS